MVIVPKPNWQQQRSYTLEQRFWHYVVKSEDPDGCWIWGGSTNKKGYGRILVNGKCKSTHRLAWELAYGEIPEGMMVLHRCDFPPCCRISHLFLGTNQDNIDDRNAKGRQAKGERNGPAKLTEDQVLQIKQLAGKVPQPQIAKMFNISVGVIGAIHGNRIWKHVGEPVINARASTRGKKRFTPEQVVEIRLKAQTMSVCKIAREYGVDHSSISDVVRRRTYKNIP